LPRRLELAEAVEHLLLEALAQLERPEPDLRQVLNLDVLAQLLQPLGVRLLRPRADRPGQHDHLHRPIRQLPPPRRRRLDHRRVGR
jgi:hypothetical protein